MNHWTEPDPREDRAANVEQIQITREGPMSRGNRKCRQPGLIQQSHDVKNVNGIDSEALQPKISMPFATAQQWASFTTSASIEDSAEPSCGRCSFSCMEGGEKRSGSFHSTKVRFCGSLRSSCHYTVRGTVAEQARNEMNHPRVCADCIASQHL